MLCCALGMAGVMDRAKDVGKAVERGRRWEFGGQEFCL